MTPPPSLQSVLKEFDEKFPVNMSGYLSKGSKVMKLVNLIEIKSFLIHSLADMLEGEGSRIKGITKVFALRKDNVQYSLGQTNGYYVAQKDFIAHLAEVVRSIKSSQEK